jgi:hypothetical protein
MATMETCLSNSFEVLECNLIEVIAIIAISAQFDAAAAAVLKINKHTLYLQAIFTHY